MAYRHEPPSRPTTPLQASTSTSQHPLKSPKLGFPEASSSTVANKSVTGNGIRSRKATPAHSPSASQVDLDVTRPTLKRLTGESGASRSSSPTKNGKTRSSLDSVDGKTVPKVGKGEREVLVHKLVKTDTIASVSLQYGITPQALRASNRLWPSDSIHLRAVLNIPLDQCNLPAATSINRISRDEDGSLIVWEREHEPEQILAPSARPPDVDLLGLEALEPDVARASFDELTSPWTSDEKGKGKATYPENDAVAQYLASTHNPYSSPTFSSPPSSRPSSSRPGSTPTYERSSSTSSLGFGPSNAAKPRTIQVSRVPASQLSFFPPPNPAFSAPPSVRTSFDAQDASSRRGSQALIGSLGPLANSLARLSVSSTPPIPHERARSSPGDAGTTPTATRKGTWGRRWDLLYFGAEEEEAIGDQLELREAERRKSWKGNYRD